MSRAMDRDLEYLAGVCGEAQNKEIFDVRNFRTDLEFLVENFEDIFLLYRKGQDEKATKILVKTMRALNDLMKQVP